MRNTGRRNGRKKLSEGGYWPSLTAARTHARKVNRGKRRGGVAVEKKEKSSPSARVFSARLSLPLFRLSVCRVLSSRFPNFSPRGTSDRTERSDVPGPSLYYRKQTTLAQRAGCTLSEFLPIRYPVASATCALATKENARVCVLYTSSIDPAPFSRSLRLSLRLSTSRVRRVCARSKELAHARLLARSTAAASAASADMTAHPSPFPSMHARATRFHLARRNAHMPSPLGPVLHRLLRRLKPSGSATSQRHRTIARAKLQQPHHYFKAAFSVSRASLTRSTKNCSKSN